MLSGVQGAEAEINRYLLLCATLLGEPGPATTTAHSTDAAAAAGRVRRVLHAAVVWTCDLCGKEEHSVPMKNRSYQQQFRMWKMPTFCRASTGKKAAAAPRALRLPLLQCLLTQPENTIQYNLLPDLGMYMRGILQRSYYSEPVRKHWVKAAAAQRNVQRGLALSSAAAAAQSSSTPAATAVTAAQQHLNSSTRAQWRYMHGICANLLMESIPCMKRAKRTPMLHLASGAAAAGSEEDPHGSDPVEVLACINVMHGTLFKLYPLGAKTPTFNARVHLMRRMLLLTSQVHTRDQLQFIRRYPSLMKLCFMEYSMNAMMDWLPCERVLLFGCRSSSAAAMQTYSNIATAMCDMFRQDAIVTGTESWQALNAAASVSIERCVRVCKFKLFRSPEPIVRGPHILPESFVVACMDSRVFAPDSMDLAMLMFGGNRNKAAGCLTVHSNLRVYALPECVAMQQIEAMDRMHSACSARLRAAQQISFCSVCAINGKGFSCKLRVCCVTRRMSCITCPPGTVVTVNMVGVLLKICSMYFYLCPSCTAIKAWAADGNDLCPWLLDVGEHGQGSCCSCSGSFASAAGASTAGEGAGHCAVCNSRNVCPRTRLTLLDTCNRVVRRVALCARHAPPESLMAMVTCLQDFDALVKQYCISKTMARRARRRCGLVVA